MTALLEAIEIHAAGRPHDVALSDGHLSLSYEVLRRAIDAAADALALLQPSAAPVGLSADNSPAWAALDLALVKLQRPVVPLPHFLTTAQQNHALAQTGASYLITDMPTGKDAAFGSFTLLGRQFTVRRLDGAAVELPAGTAKIIFTSGTTGTPKGVCLSQAALETIAESLVAAIGRDYAGTHCAMLPLGILLENVAGLYTTLLAGGRYHVPSQSEIGFAKPFAPDFSALIRALATSQATSTIMVPEILRGTMHAMATQNIKLPALKFVAVGGARVSTSLLEMADRLGLPVYEGYGLSEAASVVTLNTPAAHRRGSTGRPLAHVNLSLAEDGEICLSNPAFLGYCGGAAATNPYPTGDLGRMDEDGYLHIEGRKSNVLITAFGRNVAPEWVESELVAEPEIGQAFVFGEASPELGALIVPSSVAETGTSLGRAVARASARLPEYARIGHWSMAFPFTPGNGQLTSNGRLRRAAIADDYADVITRCLKHSGQYVSFFERLVAETEAERSYLLATPQIQDGLAGRISLETYRLYLAEAYHHVRHTVPLLTLVRDALAPQDEWLRPALDNYIVEESGHEEWILDDIKNAGGNAESVRHSLPRPATEFMVAYAYDTVSRMDPIGFFGMVFVLEGTSTQLATRGAEALMRSLNLPENCFRYLTSHGAIDIAHMKSFQRLMNRMDEPRHQAAIIHMAKRIYVLFADVFRSIPHERTVQNAA